MTTLICPYTASCIIYKNWFEQTKDRRVNIILERDFSPKPYSCLALNAHNDPCAEGGIPINEEVLARIEPRAGQNLEDVDCSHLTLLNKFSDK